MAEDGFLISSRGAAVVTPYYAESLEVLKRCHNSCMSQEAPLRHVMVADGDARHQLDAWDIDHLVLPVSHRDNGNTPRCMGAISAMNRGYWPIMFLDADNWFRPWHVRLVLDLKERHPSADVLAMARQCVLPDGTPIPGPPDEDLCLQHVDTSCFVFYPSAFRALAYWGMMPPYLGPVCDRFVLDAIRQLGLTIAGTMRPSVVFTAHYGWAYKSLNRAIPDDVHDIDWESILLEFDSTEILSRTGVRSEIVRKCDLSLLAPSCPQGTSLRAESFLLP